MYKKKYFIIFLILIGLLGFVFVYLNRHTPGDRYRSHSQLMPYDPSIKAPPLPSGEEIREVELRKQKSEWIKPTKPIPPAPPLMLEDDPFAQKKISKTTLIKPTHPIPPAPPLPRWPETH
jgi:hypothetical protein